VSFRLLHLASFFVVIVGLFFPHSFLFAQVNGNTVLERRAALERELAGIELEIEAQRTILQGKQRESVSLERDLAILNARINAAELSIRARNLEIRKLGTEINGKENTIGKLGAKLGREKDSLSQLLRKTRELDNFSIVEVILANKNLSEFFRDLDDFTSIKVSLRESFRALESTQKKTNVEKIILESKQSEEQELKSIQELQKRRIGQDKKEKAQILKISKGEEARYKKVVREKEKSAAAIRSELFALRGTKAIPFEKALDLVNLVSRKTKVRPALLLGIIAEESNLGENVGQCLLTNKPEKGDGKGVNTGRIFKKVMKPGRDVDIFVNITRKLGLNPYNMLVSCPPSYGYGGAMGPAQFIPSTWVLYEDKVATLTGNNPPNPWDPLDAFMASGALLKDNGAARGGYRNERLAALRYFAGWRNATKPAYSFYGDEVMTLAAKYQRQIDILRVN